MSIKKTLQRSILLIAVIPITLTTIFAYITATAKYMDINKETAKKAAADYSRGFVSRLETQLLEISGLADTGSVKKYLSGKAGSSDTSSDSAGNSVEESLTRISDNFNGTVAYYLYDADGRLVISSFTGDSPNWSDIMDTPVSSYKETAIVANSSFSENTMDILAPVTAKKQVVGLIRANISVDYFDTFLSDNRFILDEHLNPLFGYSATETDGHFLQYIERQEFPVSAEPGFAPADSYPESSSYIYGYASIPEYHWLYIARQDTSVYAKVVSTLPAILLIFLILVIIFSLRTSRSLVEKYTEPIVELNHNMQRAAEGQLDVHCTLTGEHEFTSLAENFNQMMEIISQNYSDALEAKKALEDSQNELKQNYAHIEKLAYTDGLTGLYNRMAFFKYATEILSQNKGGIQNHAVIFIDLDGFKAINDTLGHDYGDLLLQAVAAQFSSYIDEDDILARNGGDEFVILRNHVESQEKLEEFLSSLVAIANHPFVLDDETVHVTISAGIALFPQNGLSLSELMKNADIAMYTSKSSGKNSYTFFYSTMEDEVNRRNDLIDILRDAIKNQDVYLLYQPQADISTGEIIGCEALMRLNSPIVGFVSPDEFIPVAEECGLIDELGEWALVEACNFNQRLIDSGFKPLRISVNVSTAQLRGDRLIHAIEALPEKTAMPLRYLEIELTESVLMKNFDHNLALINRMKELDIHIALDDFGTGYSSFSYLTKIPINTLKIDKSFIAGICENENDTYIAGTIINLAHQLGITVIAEGVETIEQLRILQEQTCDILQGYFFSRAISEADFIELLKVNS
ncbi:MAG: EAL domain-containing protein [Bacteroidales bacterium]|nr:EAL domain-containing protein [Clostridium sp.]MCM1203895.1 EAL domain-containing protein [Bacteroidales bacterium]